MLKHVLRVLALVLLVAIGIVVYLGWPDTARLTVDQVTGRRPTISDPRAQTIPTIAVARAVGWPAGAAPTPAPGLKVQPFATGLDHPRWLYRLPSGDVLVAESNAPGRGRGIAGLVERWLMGRAGAGAPSPDRIVLLRDADGDGRAETRTLFMTGLHSPSGMLLDNGMLYIADTDALVRVPYADGTTHIDATPEQVIALPHGDGGHWARNVIASGDGRTLYVSVGSSTNIADHGLAAERNRAAILQVWPKEKTFRIYASGLRNPNGMAINPWTRALWTVVNERDMLGSDLAPDYLTQVEFGDQFGWPWYYWGGYPDDRVEPKNPALQEYSKRPDYALGPHVAALGLAFSTDATLGDAWAHGAFVSEHGSWNRKPVSGYKLVYVPFAANGFPTPGTKPVDVLTGFLNARGQAQGRPVGVIADRTGALLVADDVGGVVWRVSGGR